jgi:hypothetical protein
MTGSAARRGRGRIGADQPPTRYTQPDSSKPRRGISLCPEFDSWDAHGGVSSASRLRQNKHLRLREGGLEPKRRMLDLAGLPRIGQARGESSAQLQTRIAGLEQDGSTIRAAMALIELRYQGPGK